MKKILSIVLAVVIFAVAVVPSFASGRAYLQFNEDGKFKIMMMNDTQDMILKDVMSASLVKKAVAQENPDLIVMVGDQLTDFFPGATRDQLEKCMRQFLDVIEETGVPFVFTYGNHDHDWEDIFPLEDQMAVYQSYSNCINPNDTLGTFNLPVRSSDGNTIPFNVYVFDTHNKAEGGLLTGYEGVRPEQLDWYRETRDSLKEDNNDNYVPSIVFQHIPVKEIYQFLDEVPMNTDLTDAVFDLDNNRWFTLNDKVVSGVLGEVPCSESTDGNTGEYQAWLEKGDIIGAYFGHDHVNNFVGITDEGLQMGYNGGTGFSTYGRGGDRSVRIFEIDENDPASYTTREVTYNDVSQNQIDFFIMDAFSPVLATVLGKFLVSFIPQWLRNIVACF